MKPGLADVYAAALDDFEERWLGTRSHVRALEARREHMRWLMRMHFAYSALVPKPFPLMIASVS